MRKWIVAALVILAFAGCTSTPTTQAPIDEKPPATTPPSSDTGASTQGMTQGGVSGTQSGTTGQTNPLKDPNNILSKRSAYFDYDQYVVKDEYRPIIQAHAKYLQSNRNARVILQGNTDERGTREYNIALGQNRADAVKKLMVLLGASEAQIETVSFGKEKPHREGHDESSWAENRRADIVYAGE